LTLLFHEKGKVNHHLWKGCFTHKTGSSEIKTAEFITNKISWHDTTVLSVHSTTQNK